MERVVRVNAIGGSSEAAEPRGELGVRFNAAIDQGEQFGQGNRGDQGPCLYFGPAGQRCKERALAGGFCARHTSNAGPREATVTVSPRKVIAILAAGVALWPILADVVRAILRYIH
jgi:hypothetical protein